MLVGSCREKEYEFTPIVDFAQPVKPGIHKWFYFSESGFEQVDKPEYAPVIQNNPWTECVRLSAAGITSDGSGNKAYGIVSGMGLLTFNKNGPELVKDISIFENRTAGNLVFVDDSPVFSVYKSSFFNETLSSEKYKNALNQHHFLIQYDERSKIFYPLLDTTNLSEEEEAEVVDFFWDGFDWTCEVKYIERGKNLCAYYKWVPNYSVTSLTPLKGSKEIRLQEIEAEDFRRTKSLVEFSKAPENLQNVLKDVSSRVYFNVEAGVAGGASPVVYSNVENQDKVASIKGKALSCKNWTSVLFEDGTFYFQGAIKGQRVLRAGKPVVLRLPKLPDNYVYTSYVITGNTLYAGWEEELFYHTGRTGFVSVNLEDTLYSVIQ